MSILDTPEKCQRFEQLFYQEFPGHGAGVDHHAETARRLQCDRKTAKEVNLHHVLYLLAKEQT